MARRIPGAALLALALALSVPSIASATTTIGSTTQPSGSSPNFGSSPGTYVQLSSASFAVAAPSVGRITQWSTNTTGATAGALVKLVVLRPAGGGTYAVLAVDTESLPNPLPASNIATFQLASPIPVNAGDQIGISAPSSNAVMYWSGGTTPASDVLGIYSTSTPSPPAPGQTLQLFGSSPSIRANVSAAIDTSVDVGVTSSTAPAKPSVGNLAVLGSTITNPSTGAVPVTFTDAVPAGLTIDSVIAGNGSCTVSGQTVTCTIPDVPAGGSVAVNVLVTPGATGSYVNHASVTPGGGLTDPNPANNTATATLSVNRFATNACTVPNLRGASTAVAKRVLKQLGCKVKVQRKHGSGVARGAVLKTKRGPGTYQLGRTVTLLVRK